MFESIKCFCHPNSINKQTFFNFYDILYLLAGTKMGVFLHYLCICFWIFEFVSPKLNLPISKILFDFEGSNVSILSFIPYHFTLQHILCGLILFCAGSPELHIYLPGKSTPFSYLCFSSIHRLSIADPVSAPTPELLALYLDSWNQITAAAAAIAKD